ncbi:YihY/virulence factor BrkB family protein [soil metagenome]
MNPRVAFDLLKQTATEWSNDNASRLSAALSYYAIFSIAPLLVILIAIIGLVFGQAAAEGRIAEQLSGLFGTAAAQTIQSAVAATGSSTSHGIIATAVSLCIIVFGASGLFGELKNALNTVWGVKAKPGFTITNIVRDKLLSFSVVLTIGFLLLVSLAISAVLTGLSGYLATLIALPPVVWQMVDFVVSLGVISVLFGMIFKILPNVTLRWGQVVPGAIITALLFTIGKMGLAWYLGRGSVGSSFGAAGSVVVVLFWVYYASSILFFGAEFTKVYTRHRGHQIVPDAFGMLISAAPAGTLSTEPEHPDPKTVEAAGAPR